MNKLGLKSAAAGRIESLWKWLPGANVNVEGLEKTGKNHFCFTAPDPILCISGDRRVNFLAKKLGEQLGKRIHAARFRYEIPAGADDSKIKAIVRPVWREAEELFWEALRSDSVRTIVIDTGTWAWETKRLAAFGKTTKVLPVFYGVANAQFERMLLAAEDYPSKHVLWIHKMDYLWKSREGRYGEERFKTTKLERKGFKNVGFDVQASLRTAYDPDKREFSVKVVDNAFDADCNGMVFKRAQCNYASVMSMITGTSLKEWR